MSGPNSYTAKELADEVDDIGAALVLHYGHLRKDVPPGPPLALVTRLRKVRDELRKCGPSLPSPNPSELLEDQNRFICLIANVRCWPEWDRWKAGHYTLDEIRAEIDAFRNGYRATGNEQEKA